MQPPLFYAPPEARDGDLIRLPTDEAKHASRVMRLGPGDLIVVVDGLGGGCRAEIASVTKTGVAARVHSEVRDYGEPSVRLTLAAGLSVGLKFDTVVQRGTELGVSRFVPLLTAKSKVQVDDPKKARAKVNRWTKVAAAAMKQSRRSCLPDVATPTLLADFLSQRDPDDPGLIFHPDQEAVSLETVDLAPNTKRLALLVGPESGFSADEVGLARETGFQAVSLGRRILRTETAGPTTVALVMARLGEFR